MQDWTTQILGSRFSGIWTRASDGARFDCTVSSKNKLMFNAVQSSDVNSEATKQMIPDPNIGYTVNISKSSITDDGQSHIKGCYDWKGLISWPNNSDKSLWIKGKLF